jgi:hypothetical protein
MNEQNRKQIIIAALLAVALVSVMVYQFVLREPPALEKPPKEEQAGTQAGGGGAAAKAPGKFVPEKQEEKAVPAEEIDIKALIDSVEVKPLDYPTVRIARDPMAPLVGVMRPEPSASENEGTEQPPVVTQIKIDTTASKQVSGIIWDKKYPVAIVDDMVVPVGYVFPNGAQVYQIEPTRVIFKVGDTMIPVEMKEF